MIFDSRGRVGRTSNAQVNLTSRRSWSLAGASKRWTSTMLPPADWAAKPARRKFSQRSSTSKESDSRINMVAVARGSFDI